MNRDLWTELEPHCKQKVQRLHELMVYLRWLVVLFCWCIFAPISLWSLREELTLIGEHFTWSAVRYTIIFNPLEIVLLALCIGMTTGVLVWQSRNILWGMPPPYQKRLQQQVRKIEARGKTHPLWNWLEP
ncbi:MAG: hypothetical protein AAGA60_09020 [Cyanobacteria bacterium P01_E01_bin.42]